MVRQRSFIAGKSKSGGLFIFITVCTFPTLIVEALISNGFTHGRLAIFTLSQLGVAATCGYLIGGLIGANFLTSSGQRRKGSRKVFLVISQNTAPSKQQRIPYSPPITPAPAGSGGVHEIFTKK